MQPGCLFFWKIACFFDDLLAFCFCACFLKKFPQKTFVPSFNFLKNLFFVENVQNSHKLQNRHKNRHIVKKQIGDVFNNDIKRMQWKWKKHFYVCYLSKSPFRAIRCALWKRFQVCGTHREVARSQGYQLISY